MNTETNSFETIVDNINELSSLECEEWLKSDKDVSVSWMIKKSLGNFYKSYYKENGKRQGIKGYVLAVLEGFGPYLAYAKYWRRKLGIENPEIIPAELSEATRAEREDDASDRWKLSAVILTKNEETKIRNCLESLKWIDEIVVVDGCSTDSTADICREYGCKVVEHKFEGDFGEERNIGIDNSTGDWVLQLDADEAVTEGFRKKMMEILRKKDERYVAYKFMRKNFFMNRFMKYGGWYHHSHHLFRKGFARYDGRVHHQLLIDGKEGFLNGDIEHNPFQSLTQLTARQNRYTTIEAREILELRGKVPAKEIEYNVRTKPLKLFRKFYVKKQGFRLGKHGLIFSVFFAWVHFIKWAKYWEMVNEKENQS